jgi:hypothetical protein
MHRLNMKVICKNGCICPCWVCGCVCGGGRRGCVRVCATGATCNWCEVIWLCITFHLYLLGWYQRPSCKLGTPVQAELSYVATNTWRHHDSLVDIDAIFNVVTFLYLPWTPRQFHVIYLLKMLLPFLTEHLIAPFFSRLQTGFVLTQSVKDMPVVQDGPPPGGFPSIRYARRIPSTGPTGFTLFAVGAAIMGFGFYRVRLFAPCPLVTQLIARDVISA